VKVIIHVSKTWQKDILKHRLGTRSGIHHTPGEIMNFLWVWQIGAQRVELVAKSLDSLSIKRTGCDG
jgi:hypothetical protein